MDPFTEQQAGGLIPLILLCWGLAMMGLRLPQYEPEPQCRPVTHEAGWVVYTKSGECER